MAGGVEPPTGKNSGSALVEGARRLLEPTLQVGNKCVQGYYKNAKLGGGGCTGTRTPTQRTDISSQARAPGQTVKNSFQTFGGSGQQFKMFFATFRKLGQKLKAFFETFGKFDPKV